MDNATRQKLKQDQFITATKSGMAWATENRQTAMALGAVVLGVVVLAVACGWFYSYRSEKAATGFGAAMQIYQSPVTQAGEPAQPGVKSYSSSLERSKAANAAFMAVADQYGMTRDGRVALYFGGLTYVDQGQYSSAETALNKVAHGWDSNLGALAKLALAQMYRQTGRDQQAVDIYHQLTAKPATTVPAGLAQLQLADMYTSEGKADMAKQVYAELKDKDAKSPAAMIAQQRLTPGGGMQQ